MSLLVSLDLLLDAIIFEFLILAPERRSRETKNRAQVFSKIESESLSNPIEASARALERSCKRAVKSVSHKILVAEGPFRVRSGSIWGPFGVRSGSVQANFGAKNLKFQKLSICPAVAAAAGAL